MPFVFTILSCLLVLLLLPMHTCAQPDAPDEPLVDAPAAVDEALPLPAADMPADPVAEEQPPLPQEPQEQQPQDPMQPAQDAEQAAADDTPVVGGYYEHVNYTSVEDTCVGGECFFMSNGVISSATTEKETVAYLILGVVGGTVVLFMTLAGLTLVLAFHRRRERRKATQFSSLDHPRPVEVASETV